MQASFAAFKTGLLRDISIAIEVKEGLGKPFKKADKATLKRRFRFFPRNGWHILGLLEVVLPTPHPANQETVGIQERRQKEKGQTVESEMKSATKPQASTSGDVSRQLADQLKTVFVAALLSLWAATLRLGENVPVKRGAWLPWVIASVFLFFWVVYRREKIRWPKLRWVLPFVAVALLWLMYLISGFSFPIGFYTSVAIGLLVWTVLLLAVLLIVMTRGLTEGKMGRTIRRFVTWGGSVSLPVTLFVLLTSVLLGWTRLWNAGMRGWWMDPLLYLGTIIFVVVALVPFRRADDS